MSGQFPVFLGWTSTEERIFSFPFFYQNICCGYIKNILNTTLPLHFSFLFMILSSINCWNYKSKPLGQLTRWQENIYILFQSWVVSQQLWRWFRYQVGSYLGDIWSSIRWCKQWRLKQKTYFNLFHARRGFCHCFYNSKQFGPRSGLTFFQAWP